jgi:hypothetical protein
MRLVTGKRERAIGGGGVPDTVGIRAESAVDLQVFVEEFVGLERTSAREKKRVGGGDRRLFIGGFKRAGGARV